MAADKPGRERSERDQAADRRDEAAYRRDRVADQRDHNAAQRDAAAARRDKAAEESEQPLGSEAARKRCSSPGQTARPLLPIGATLAGIDMPEHSNAHTPSATVTARAQTETNPRRNATTRASTNPQRGSEELAETWQYFLLDVCRRPSGRSR